MKRFEPAWELITKYSLKMEPQIDLLICSLCKKLMVDAFQNACKCNFCRKCITDYIDGADKFCPGQNSSCHEEFLSLNISVCRSSVMNETIYNSRVCCPNELCPYITELHKLPDHLKECMKQTTECPFVAVGCKYERASKDKILSHIGEDAFRHSELLMLRISNTRNDDTTSLKEDIGKKDIQIKELKEELELVKDPSQTHQYNIDGITYYRCVDHQLTINREAVEKLKKEFKELSDETHLQLTNLTAKVTKIEEEVAKVVQRTDAMEKTLEMRRKSGEENVKIMNNLMILSPYVRSDFVWRFCELSNKMKSMRGKFEFSEPFHSNGYKVCIRVYIEGDNIGLHCMLMKGEHDGDVQWPMTHGITLCVLDQNSHQPHKTVAVHRDNHQRAKAFDKPEGPMNTLGIGEDSFLLYTAIKDNQSVTVNDSIVVSCLLVVR